MTLKNGIECGSQNQQKINKPRLKARAKYAEAILPEEVWAMIFAQLTDDNDIVKCSQTCTLFRSLLKNKIASQALRVFLNHVSESNLLMKEKDVLSCRLVSSRWKGIVDNFLQSGPSRGDLSCYRAKSLGFQHSYSDQVDKIPNRFGSILLKLHDLAGAQKLVDRITANAKATKNNNVFIGRHLILGDTYDGYNESVDTVQRNKQRFYDIVSHLLEVCGDHIWYLSIRALLWDNVSGWFLHTFWGWLRLLPNLRMMTCQITLDYMQTTGQLDITAELLAGISRQPFPHLPQLATMQMNGVPDVVLHSALNVNRHVRNLEINSLPYRARLPLNIRRWSGTALTEFCITICHINEFDELTSIPWGLEKLTLSFALGPHPFFAFEHRLQRLEHFGTTLKYLRMKVPKINLGTHPKRWELQLPLLEELHLHLINHVCLDFILSLKSLKKLKLSVIFWKEVGEPEVMLGNRVCAMSKLYESHIWEAMPSLRYIQVHINFRVKVADVGTPRHRYPQLLKYFRYDKIWRKRLLQK